eukprot:GILI01019732.1.p1 GENE.GILI01019732.1~~GILI01019732.1.p1  ORF type:complete len:363 (-),score=31.31 GILI01019732.1:82-1107(-)
MSTGPSDPSLTTATQKAASNDRRIQLVGLRKSGYCGHVPKCIYYDRERLPASIHPGSNLPPRGKFQMNGTMSATQSMLRKAQQQTDPITNSVPSVNEIGLGLPTRGAFNARAAASVGATGPKPAGYIGGHEYDGVGIGGAPKAVNNAPFARPFSNNPNGQFGHYAQPTAEVAYLVGGTGGQFASTVSPPRSPTARYYKQVQEHDPKDLGPHPFNIALANNGNAVRHRHVGAGGVCCGSTDPAQYGQFLHHSDSKIHGVPSQLLPHVYKSDGYAPETADETKHNSTLRSRGGADVPSRSASANNGPASGSHIPERLTPFPRYPVLRGPNRMGPRGLETFLSN